MKATAVTFASLYVLQLLGVCGSVVAAAIEIESIMASGPIFSILGFVVAFGWFASRSISTVIFGLSAGLISLFLFLLINILDWGPSDAAFPVTLMLLGFETVILPIGLVALHKTLSGSPTKEPSRFRQFNLRSLLLLTTVVAICLAAMKLSSNRGSGVLLTVAVGFCTATVMAIAIVVFHAVRRSSFAGSANPALKTQIDHANSEQRADGGPS